ncbi:MAG: hypothetical protein AAFY11_03800 [Cyanobacteria bacterium J06641_5]
MTDTTVASKVASKAPNQEFAPEPLATAAAPRSPHPTSTPPKLPLPAIPEVWQTLRDNFSILWLLAAGVFIIVAASTGLAITQWQTLPPVLQYSLLWAYTLGFAGISLWTTRQGTLVLTGRSLQILAGLLIPVNFWAMHSFRLWSFGLAGWGAIAIGTFTLGGWVFLARLPLPGLYLGISAMQLLWGQPIWLGLALPGGVIALAIAQELRKRPQSLWAYYGLGLAFLRSLATGTIPLANFGLALGAWGWLLGRSLNRSESRAESQLGPFIAGGDALAGGLLLWGTIATWTNPWPWQATGAVLLGIELCLRRLRRSPRSLDILGLFVSGGLGYALIWQWWPPAWQTATQGAIAGWLEISTARLDVLGVLPYLFLFLGSLTMLRQRYQISQQLLRWSDAIVLAIASASVLISVWFPGPRSLSIACLSGLLAWIGGRRRNRAWLASAHGSGLLALASGIAWKFNPSERGWLAICLVLAILEWCAAAWGDRLHRRNVLQRMALRQGWPFGALLAGLGYALLGSPQIWGTGWALLWEIIPVALAILAGSARIARRRQLAILATGTLGAAVFPVWLTPAYRIASLGLASLMMLFNVRNFPRVWMSATHIGYLLVYAGVCLVPILQGSQWFLAGAIALWCLFLGQQRLSKIYARASAGWAGVLAIALASGLGIHLLLARGLYLAQSLASPAIPWPLPASAASLMATAILWYRQRAQATDFLACSALGIATELALAAGVTFTGGNLGVLAIANLLLGWSALFWPLRRRVEGETLATGFGLLALVFHLGNFSAYSGPIVLGVALLGLVLGARQNQNTISRLAIAGITLAIVETILYGLQIDGNIGLQELALALTTTATAIAILYEAIAPFWPNWLRLDRDELKQAAKVHGLIGIGFFSWMLAIGLLFPNWLPNWGVALGVALAGWAFGRGRTPATDAPTDLGAWIYLGWGELIASGIYARLALPNRLKFLDDWWVVALGLLAWGALLLPWHRLGWTRSRPWERSAVGLTVFAALLHIGQALNAYSGLELLVFAPLLLVLGARWQTRALTYGALAAISIAIGELLWFWLPLPGTDPDLPFVIAIAATTVACLDQLLAERWPTSPKQRLNLTHSDLSTAACLHWWLANLAVVALAIATGGRPDTIPLWALVLPPILAAWALARGRQGSALWIYGGATELLGTLLWARALIPNLQTYEPWWAVFASFIGLACFHLPWEAWGWRSRQPWQHIALAVPGITVFLSYAVVAIGSLFFIAGSYGWLAWQERRWRWSYGSVLFLQWGLWTWFARLDWLDPAVIAALIGGAILYIAQVDPDLRQPKRRHWRHWWRCAGSVPLCATAAIVYGDPGIAPAAIGLGFSLTGLALRVRSFLWVGSLTLIWTAGDRALTLSQQYAFARWLIGIALGVTLVSIGALFEGQRGQRLTAFLRSWWQDLEQWD